MAMESEGYPIKGAIYDILEKPAIRMAQGETEEEFAKSKAFIDKVDFYETHIFKYSKRKGTKAAVMENQVPEDVVKRNFDRVLSTVQEMARQRVSLLEGKTMSALVEEMNEHDSSLVTGRLSNNIIVHFPGDESLVGSIVDVVLDKCHGFYYVGHIAK